MKGSAVQNESTSTSTLDKNDVENSVKTKDSSAVLTSNDHVQVDHLTSFKETLMHFLRGNIGAGVFGMGAAFKHGGIIFSPIVTIFIAILSLRNQHVLIRCSKKLNDFQSNSEKLVNTDCPDFAETVELCFRYGPPGVRPFSGAIKLFINYLICVTQLGFCCVYIVFIASNYQQLWHMYVDYEWNLYIRIILILLPLLLLSLITNLKHLVPFSTLANLFMGTGFGLTLYYIFQDLPDIRELRYTGELSKLPLCIGSAIYAFEGIALVLPLKNIMKNPRGFDRPLGVLNIGMIFIAIIFTSFGLLGYWRWGDKVKDSMTLNLPEEEILAQLVKLLVLIGTVCTYPLQFFVAIQIMWSGVEKRYGKFSNVGPQLGFRIFFVLVTFVIAELIPHLQLIIALIGSVCSTTLALTLPPTIELISSMTSKNGLSPLNIMMDIFILGFSVLAFSTGAYESISALIKVV